MHVHELNIDDALEAARTWLFKMQVASDDFGGGFLSGLNFSWLSSWTPFIYTEITGYGLKTLLNFIRKGECALRWRAKAAADFLLKLQSDAGAFARGVSYKQGRIIDTCYAFDTAVCGSALLDFYDLEPNMSFLHSSRKAGYWLVKKAQIETGAFMSKYEKGRFVSERRWYGDQCCLHGKNIILLLKLWGHTRESLFRSSAEKAANWVTSLQLPNGAFAVNSRENYVFTHAHCYATEGLLYAFYAVGNKHYLSSAAKAAAWLSGVQEANGGLDDIYGDFSLVRRVQDGLFPIRMKRLDAVAQAIRIWVALYSLTADKRFLESAYRAAGFLLRAQFKKEKQNLSGGFYQQMNSFLKLPTMRTWSCMFLIQALSTLRLPGPFEQIMQEIM